MTHCDVRMISAPLIPQWHPLGHSDRSKMKFVVSVFFDLKMVRIIFTPPKKLPAHRRVHQKNAHVGWFLSLSNTRYCFNVIAEAMGNERKCLKPVKWRTLRSFFRLWARLVHRRPILIFGRISSLHFMVRTFIKEEKERWERGNEDSLPKGEVFSPTGGKSIWRKTRPGTRFHFGGQIILMSRLVGRWQLPASMTKHVLEAVIEAGCQHLRFDRMGEFKRCLRSLGLEVRGVACGQGGPGINPSSFWMFYSPWL